MENVICNLSATPSSWGFACYIVEPTGCPLLIRHGQYSELATPAMCMHYQPSYRHQRLVNHCDLQSPLTSPANKALRSAVGVFFFFIFQSGFLEWVSLIIWKCMQTLKEN